MIKIVLGSLSLGALVGFLSLTVEAKPLLDKILFFFLDFLIVTVGVDIADNRKVISSLMQPDTMVFLLAVPLAVILGSYAGAIAIHSFIDLKLYDALLAASGFGWYSLSSVMVSTMYSDEIGTIAFLGNMLRELGAFVSVPLLAKFMRIPCAAVGGATTMDSTLPVLIKCLGMKVGIVGFFSGFILTLVIPFILGALL